MSGNSSSAENHAQAEIVDDLVENRDLDTQGTGTNSDDKTATPSRADTTTTGEKKETLLEAVMKAVQDDAPQDGDGTASTTASPAGDARTETDPKSEEAELTEEDLQPQADDTPKVQKRIKRLVQERTDARQLAERFREEASVTKTLRDFLVSNDIAREDFQLTLDLAAAMRRGDFRGFLEGVAPYVNLATQALGITLPPDLEQSVRAGKMPFETAATLSRERYARGLAEQQAQRATEVAQHTHQAHAAQQLSQTIENTVNAWEKTVRQSDPDYARKETTIRNLLWSVVQERGAPQTPEQAVEIAQEAYKRANDTIRQFAPPPRPTKAVPSSLNRASGGARAEPRSLMEAAMLGLDRARGRA